MSYKQKYLKYKTKYINYKNFLNGGAKNTNSTNDDFSLFTDEDENNKQSEKIHGRVGTQPAVDFPISPE